MNSHLDFKKHMWDSHGSKIDWIIPNLNSTLCTFFFKKSRLMWRWNGTKLWMNPWKQLQQNRNRSVWPVYTGPIQLFLTTATYSFKWVRWPGTCSWGTILYCQTLDSGGKGLPKCHHQRYGSTPPRKLTCTCESIPRVPFFTQATVRPHGIFAIRMGAAHVCPIWALI